MAPQTDPLDPQPTPSKQPGSRQAMLVLVIAFLLVFLGWRTLGRPTDRVAWAQDVQAVMAQAQAQNRPVLMNFTADWCGPCQQLKARAFSRPEVAETISRLVLPLKIDLTTPSAAGAELCQRYQIEGTPTLLLLAPDGREISRRAGVIDPDELVDWLTQPRG